MTGEQLSNSEIDSLMSAFPADQGGLGQKMGIELISASPDQVVGTIPVEGNTQPMGLLHGGASAALAETLGSIGAHLHAVQMGKYAVGLELNASHHRGASKGLVTGTATAIHLGRTTAAYEVVVTDEAGRRVCTARLTCALLEIPK